jgi:hypothetical protein
MTQQQGSATQQHKRSWSRWAVEFAVSGDYMNLGLNTTKYHGAGGQHNLAGSQAQHSVHSRQHLLLFQCLTCRRSLPARDVLETQLGVPRHQPYVLDVCCAARC